MFRRHGRPCDTLLIENGVGRPLVVLRLGTRTNHLPEEPSSARLMLLGFDNFLIFLAS